MDTVELNELEIQIDQLVESVDQLKIENHSLRQKLASSARERSKLQEKCHGASSQIKRVVSQLKEELS